jgi:putative copper export protein
VLPASLEDVRLFLHVLAATIWVGGQITLAGLVPVLRRLAPEAPRLAARRFGVIAWSAYAVLVATGIWNVLAVRAQLHGHYLATLEVKIAVVAGSGIAAWAHGAAHSARGRAIWGALTLLGALGALFLGILLAR